MSSKIIPFGDSALLAELGGSVEPAVNADVHALARAVELERATGAPWGRPVAAYASVLVPFDPLVVDTAKAIDRLRAMVEEVSREPTGTRDIHGEAVDPIVIDVRYGGEGGPDLAEVARITGLSEADVVTTHAAGTYRVYFLGFAPGFGYLGPLPTALAVPRRATPRTRVPAGTVAIAGLQTAVYPLTTPGGWQLIGRTELPLWDAHRDPPALLRQGQPVRFRALPAG